MIDRDGRARLTHFGLASVITGEKSLVSLEDTNVTNTTTWAAPEILRGGSVSKEGDIFAFAMVAVEVRTRGVPTEVPRFSPYTPLEQTFTGHPPFLINFHAAILEILIGKRPGRPATLRHEELWGIVERSWSQEPMERPTASQLLEVFRTS